MLEMRLKLVFVIVVAVGVLTACSNPNAIDVKRLRDEKLSCQELRVNINKVSLREHASKHTSKSEDDAGFADRLVGWSSKVLDDLQHSRAASAAKKRRAHLLALYKQKRCKVTAQASMVKLKVKKMVLSHPVHKLPASKVKKLRNAKNKRSKGSAKKV